jgi:hypothetical protein
MLDFHLPIMRSYLLLHDRISELHVGNGSPNLFLIFLERNRLLKQVFKWLQNQLKVDSKTNHPKANFFDSFELENEIQSTMFYLIKSTSECLK